MIDLSIIIPTYNSQNTINDTLQSIFKQTFKKFEILVIDGVSKDNTVSIVNEWIEKFSENGIQVKVISEKDDGIYFAMNKGIQNAKGDVIGILNSDDFYNLDNVLELVMNEFEQNKTYSAVFGNLYYVDPDNTAKVVRDWKSNKKKINSFRFGWMPAHPTLFVKSSVYKEYGNFDTNFTISADYELMVRMFYENKLSLGYLDKYFVCMRIGGVSNGALKSIILKMREDHRIIKRYKMYGLLTLVSKNFRKLRQFR